MYDTQEAEEAAQHAAREAETSRQETAPAGGTSTAVAVRRPGKPPIPLHNGVLSPDRWTLFARIATTTADTDFVPKGLRDKPNAIMACLLYGDSLGLHPSVSLSDVFVADGKPGISGALMLAKIREAGHKVWFEWVLDAEGNRIGATAHGQRRLVKLVEGQEPEFIVEEEDEWTYTLADAERAGLYPNSSPKAAWMKTPDVMCRWRSLAQLTRFLFPDVVRGGTVYLPDEAEEAAYHNRLVDGQDAGGGSSGEEPVDDDSLGIEYGDDPLLAVWLVALIAACNEIEAGTWLPKKVKLALKGKTQEERETLAAGMVAWIEERQGVVPERPTEENREPAEAVQDAEVVVEPEIRLD